VKLLRVEDDRYVFQLPREELTLFAITLGLYPVIPPAHQPLSKGSKPDPANQRLLNEALAEQRKENKKHVEDFLTGAGRFQEVEDAVQMTLTAAEIEWLLQVLNDVNVGNWILLGSPEKPPPFYPNSENARFLLGMYQANAFQCDLLEAIKGA
jgi:hypothetical protein